MNKKYFFFDIDNTLLINEQFIPESTVRTLQALQEVGHFVAIATGRSQIMALPYMKKFHLHNMVHDGGNGITINDQLLGIQPLDHRLCVQLVRECQQHRIPWTLFVGNQTLKLAPDDAFQKVTNDHYTKTVVVPGLDPADYDTIYKLNIACSEEDAQRFLPALKQLPWCRYTEKYFFVEPTDKAQGIFQVLEHFGGKPEDVVVFGDGLNDLTMFRPEWTSIAMGNGDEELKARATFVTKAAAEDGIEYACRKFGWIE